MAKRQRPGERGERPEGTVDLRIIGGRYRGTKLHSEPFVQATGPATGELVTRPMKHRVREAIFNLVGFDAEGKHALDVFAGTGAIGLEAISRGALGATFVERHLPTAGVVRRNIEAMGVADRCEVHVTSAFLWGQSDLPQWRPPGAPDAAWLAFVSPPSAYSHDRADEMLALIEALVHHAPEGSVVVVEADQRFDFAKLPGGVRPQRGEPGWDVREYPPAVVGVLRKEAPG